MLPRTLAGHRHLDLTITDSSHDPGPDPSHLPSPRGGADTIPSGAGRDFKVVLYVRRSGICGDEETNIEPLTLWCGSQDSGSLCGLGPVILWSGLMMCHKEVSWRLCDHARSSALLAQTNPVSVQDASRGSPRSQCGSPVSDRRLPHSDVDDGHGQLRLAGGNWVS